MESSPSTGGLSISDATRLRAALIAINRLPRVGAAKVRSLERAFGSLLALPEYTPAEIAQQCKDLSLQMVIDVLQALSSGWAAEEEARAKATNVQILTWLDDLYPETLRALPSAPLCLYCVGNPQLLRQPQIAIIGTRAASLYGKEQAQRFAMRFAAAGMHVTSGLAEGIDSAAHEGALLAGEAAPGKTIAVLGAALDCVYPQSRKPLAIQIARSGGLVVSEYPFGRHADAKTFPQRNRIVAALTKGTLVIETATKGGTLITANYAQEFGRTLYALPGRVDVHSFSGNLRLIRNGDARLVTSPEEILDEFSSLDLQEGQPLPASKPDTDILPPGLSPEEEQLYKALGNDELTVDDLIGRTGLTSVAVSVALVGLRFKRRIQDRPGGRVRRTR
ncbi:MAG: DNA-processing protein DprA [Kiritimatiellae bacterium]|nr:DNA-processing protein DprA [Kiritimatiellia bacterium]